MRRREFVTLLGGAAAWPVATRAQQPATLPTIGYLGASPPNVASQWTAAFVQRLHELGWIEGRTIVIEYRWADGRAERFAEIAAEFVRLKVSLIFTYSTPSVVAAKQATSGKADIVSSIPHASLAGCDRLTRPAFCPCTTFRKLIIR
jgi:putative ABC transport system substrate-binding protein